MDHQARTSFGLILSGDPVISRIVAPVRLILRGQKREFPT
jgi:hypothetical protein